MKLFPAVTAIVVAFGCAAVSASSYGQTSPVLPAANANAAQAANHGSQLESVLNSMDKASAGFRSLQAAFQWDQYTKLVNAVDTQNGTIYFKRAGSSTEMGAHIQKPDAKIVVVSNQTVRIYFPKANEEQDYDISKNREAVESFLVLGFGSRGHDLSQKFDVQFSGNESVGGVNTAILTLIPKQESVKKMFNKIVLWIDPARGISIKQQLFQPDGDYRTAVYSDIKTNGKIPDDAFKIPKNAKKKAATPNG
jgi:outer membrane lipoprotein-sorting protein